MSEESLDRLFVNRVRELDEFESVLHDLERGRRRHLALLGLRRIGKTVLLDEVRRRHPSFPICYVALDDIVSSLETFTRSMVGQLLATAARKKGVEPPLVRTEEALMETAAALDSKLAALVKEIFYWLEKPDYGEVLISIMRLPGYISEILRIPLLVMLDEFQEITRLQEAPGTGNLLGTIRAALDRQGQVGFAVAGSRVTALRKLLGASESPLLTRFNSIPLDPFGLEAATELATTMWDAEGVRNEPGAMERLYRLSGGWPLYVHAIAHRARRHAQAATKCVTPDIIDLAFQEELFGRGTSIGQHCAYLRKTALEDTKTPEERSLLEEVLTQVALHQPITRTSLLRRIRGHGRTEVYDGVNRLIDTDFMSQQDGALSLLDPLFALWLAAEPARQDPQGILSDRRAVQKLMAWYEQRHADDRTAMGKLFEKRVENLVRQFAGQEVDGKLFGTSEKVSLPRVRGVRQAKLDDPKGLYGDGPDSYELEVVTSGDAPADYWGVEAKHRRGALTRRQVERFMDTARVIEKVDGITFHRRWIVAVSGVRSDALELMETEGILVSGIRQIEKLEHLAAAGWKSGG